MVFESPALTTGKGTMDFYVTQNLSHYIKVEIGGSFRLKYIIECLERARFFHEGSFSPEDALEYAYYNSKSLEIDKDSIPYMPLFQLHKEDRLDAEPYSEFLLRLFRRYMDFTGRGKDPTLLIPIGHALVRIIREDKNLIGEIESRDLVDLILVRRKKVQKNFDEIRRSVKRRFKNYISDKDIDQLISLTDRGLFHKIKESEYSPPINFNKMDRKRFREMWAERFRNNS